MTKPQFPQLLVSARSPQEAIAAWQGGANLIDIKEPKRGPLGRADVSVWRAVRAVLPSEALISAALGELHEWDSQSDHDLQEFTTAFQNLTYRKLGFASLTHFNDIEQRWRKLQTFWGASSWIAAAYSDHERAHSPAPNQVCNMALKLGCAGVLLDSWDKSQQVAMDPIWLTDWVAHARAHGLVTAVAGGLDEVAIERLAVARPDWFAVRGAVCAHGDRQQTIVVDRVARLARLVQGIRDETVARSNC